ncbi:phage head closure protein [Castellaniella hirudinis]|uniref:phage head closure protein n=1 Tax=Castellaniella hirudinis TaxID=1144617 RepID=UPI0039C44B8C
MKAGTFNRRIMIQDHVQEQDDTGQIIDIWVDIATAWAWIKTQSGMSTISNGVAISLTHYSFRIRYRTDVDVGMRVFYNGVSFDIQYIAHDLAHHEWTDLVCQTTGE